MDWVNGGYFLVRSSPRREWMSPSSPQTLWSMSACICDTLPDSWALPWSSDSAEVRKAAQQSLGLTHAEFLTMCDWVEGLRISGHYGWSNVFLYLPTAREFVRRYAFGLPDVRLLGIALPESEIDRFLDEAAPVGGQGETGVFEVVSARRPPVAGGSVRGFEVLGYEFGSFHSFLCNHLWNEYSAMGLAFNENGLIDDLDDALRAAEFTNRESTGAEPVLWQPWRIDEYPMSGAR